jgi:hypothetical protein
MYDDITDSAERFCQTGPHIIVERLRDLKAGDADGLGFPYLPHRLLAYQALAVRPHR